jgi:aspartate aminotransferase
MQSRSRRPALCRVEFAFCRFLLERHDGAVVPGSRFGLAPYFCLSYATSAQHLREAVKHIAKAFREPS